MEYLEHRCSKSGDGTLIVRNGKTKDGRQRYKCKLCSKRFLKNYSYKVYFFNVNSYIVSFLKEGVGYSPRNEFRKMICYSKSLVMLNACLILYFWT